MKEKEKKRGLLHLQIREFWKNLELPVCIVVFA